MIPPIEILEQLDSTNAEARRRAEAGEGGPVWIVARRQNAGRGRRGREWRSDSGNLFATLLLTTRRAPAEAAQVTFIAALATAQSLDAFAARGAVTIKWPNDVLLDGRKAAGILVESGQAPGGGLWLAIGIGVNLAHAPDDTEWPTAALAQHLRPDIAYPPTVDAAAAVLAEAFDAWLVRWEQYGFEPVLDAWRRRCLGLTGPATARLPHETISGTADGVEADGALRLRLADGSLRLISAGDVFFGDAA